MSPQVECSPVPPPNDAGSPRWLPRSQGWRRPALTTPFSGVLRIASSASGIAVVGLRLTINQRHDIVVTTTPPADENAAPAESDLFFPHLVDSGGWSTQFILFSRSAGRTTNGLIRFTGQDGQPLELFAAPTTVPASP